MSIEYHEYDAEEAKNREVLQTKLRTIDKAIDYIKEGKNTLVLNPINHADKELHETNSKSKKIPTSIIDRIRNKVQEASGKTTAPFKLTAFGNDNDNSDHSYKIDTQSRQISTCSICGEEVELVNLRKHIEVTCVGLPMTCSEIGCGAVFPRSELKNHQKKECIVAKKRRQMVESSIVRKQNDKIELENFLKPAVKVQNPKAPPLAIQDENIEYNNENADLLEAEFQAQLKIDMENAILSKLTECKDCGEEIRVTQIEYHQKSKCKNRLIYCSNRQYGCKEEVPLSFLKKHLESVCKVEKKKEIMISNSNLRRELVVCIGCGQNIPLMFMKQHEDDSIIGTFPKCSNRKVHCKNHSHGCDVMVRLNDRKKHEEVDGDKNIRSALYFDGDGASMSIGEDDIPCPWTAEYWLYRPPAEESAKCFLRNFAANLINYAAKWKIEYSQRTKVMGMIKLLKGDDSGVDMGEKERKKLVKKLAGQVIIYEDVSLGTFKACQEVEISIRGLELNVDEIKATGGFEAVTNLAPIQPGHKERLHDEFLERERKDKELQSKNKPDKEIENKISTKNLKSKKLKDVPPVSPVEVIQDIFQNVSPDENIEKDLNLIEENVNNIPVSIVSEKTEEKNEEIIPEIILPEEILPKEEVIKIPDPDEYIGQIYKIVDLALLDKQKAWDETENLSTDELIKILIKMSNNKKRGLKLLMNTKASWNQYLECMQPIHYALIQDQKLLVEWRVEAGLIEKEKKKKKEKKLSKEEIKKAAKKAKDLKRRELKKKKGKESVALLTESTEEVKVEEVEEIEEDRGKLKDRAADLIRVGVGAEVLAISNTVCENTGGHCRICIDLNGKVGIVTTKGVVTGGAESFEFSSTVPRQQWVHIAFTCTASPKNRVILYINGEAVGTAIGCAFPLPMGRVGGAPGYQSFVGALLDVRYWRKLRSAVEIQRSRNRLIDMNANANVATAKDNKRKKKNRNEVEEDDNDKTQQIDLSSNGIVCYYPFEDGLSAPNVYDVTEFRFRTDIEPAPANKSKGFTWLNVEFMPTVKEIDPTKPRDFEEPIVPIPSYQQRGLCQVQLKRFRVAMQGRALQREVDCPLGCGDKIRMVAVRFHVGFECMKRRIRCRFDTCKESFPLQDQQQHELYECEQIYVRDDILERKAKKAKPVLCQFCSESMMKKDLKKHVKNECLHRTISCIHPDCKETMQAHGLEDHLKYKCTSIAIKKKIWLITRARRRSNYPRPWGIEISVDGDEDDTTDNENEISQDENSINEKIIEKTIDVIE
jgi:hypothetical protein